jgi:hypothetical protein
MAILGVFQPLKALWGRAATLAACSSCALLSGSAAAQYGEYDVKAEFLVRFIQYVEWPRDVEPGSGSAVTIGVFGRDPFRGTLARSTQGKDFGGRSVFVRLVRSAAEAEECDVLFVPAGEESRSETLVRALAGKPVLIVTESPGMAARGSMINFYLESNRVRFEINHDAARAVRLTISSRLLNLARIVRTAGSQ